MKQASIPGKAGKHKEIWIGMLIALLVVVLLSPLASSSPDGLEKVAEDLAFLDKAEGREVISSPLPDYAVPGMENTVLSGILAGITGTLLTFGAVLVLTKTIASSGKNKQGVPETTGEKK